MSGDASSQGAGQAEGSSGAPWYQDYPITARLMPIVPEHSPPNYPPPEELNHLYGVPNVTITPPPQPIHSRRTRVFMPRHPGALSSALAVTLWMNVPSELPRDKQGIAGYIREFKQELDWFRGWSHACVKHVVCSLCLNEHAPKPSNLE
ncbi:hypothetical protein FRC11_010092, partial [Ceratobasidium sp. 423]